MLVGVVEVIFFLKKIASKQNIYQVLLQKKNLGYYQIKQEIVESLEKIKTEKNSYIST